MIIGRVPFNVSKAHRKVAELLEQIVTGHRIYSEYSLSNLIKDDEVLKKRVSRLKLDFYDETFGLAIEIQGKQHREFVKFFHGDVGGLDRQKMNDRLTKSVCNLAGVILIEINPGEEVTEEMIRSWYE